MNAPRIEKPADGSRIVADDSTVILIGQPPDIVKGLLRKGIVRFDTLVLPDVREHDGSLLNNLEFPLYAFLFVAKGLADNRRLNLVGDDSAISQALRLLRITLIGPTPAELDAWATENGLKQEWLDTAHELSLRYPDGRVMPVEDFFNLVPFANNQATIGQHTIERLGNNHFTVSNGSGTVSVDLKEDEHILPPYPVVTDYFAGGLNKFSIEVLGGASGFSTTEPCTGLVMCFNGSYILIDSVPFLNRHLAARGISKNQVSALFLTHLHDDHCSMFPLMEMPHRVEVITTREIFGMAMDKLACGLGWKTEIIEQHFQLVEVRPGETIDYYGLNIEVHNTVHSIPTIGATFGATHRGKTRDVCVVGDNQSMTKIREMGEAGIVRQSTIDNLDRLYHQKFHLLIADGGAGDIHGDPADALQSASERVVFVHVDDVPDMLKTTFSVVSSGKRYTLFEGGSAIDTARIHHHLTEWLGQPLPNRWLNNLLIEQEIYRYNADDVIIVEGSSANDAVYLLLTGYCDVVKIDNGQRLTVASLQAGDVIGEMATLTGAGVRNASVIATTPVTVCVFNAQAFHNFIRNSGMQKQLETRWQLRPIIKRLPQFSNLASTVIDKLTQYCDPLKLNNGQTLKGDSDHLYIFTSGSAIETGSGKSLETGEEFGWNPFADALELNVTASSPCLLIRITRENLSHLIETVPQFNYQLRKRYAANTVKRPDWLLGKVRNT
jgi:hypothetical protein